MENLIKNENQIITNNSMYIEKYLKYLDVSELTTKEYSVGLKKFFKYCIEYNVNKIQREDVINFREYLKENNKEAATINLYLTSVKSFFKWLEYEGIYKDITKNIKALPISDTHKREPLTVEQIQNILENCQNDKERLIILLTVTTGLRCNELSNIRLKDFVVKNDTILLYVLGKARQGMRTDSVVVSKKIYEKVLEFAEKNNLTEYLFISESNNNKGEQLSTRAIRNIVNKIYEKTGIKSEEIVFHSLRHSFCNINIENEVSLIEVSKAMRHKNIQTTMRYVKDIEARNNKSFNTINNILCI